MLHSEQCSIYVLFIDFKKTLHRINSKRNWLCLRKVEVTIFRQRSYCCFHLSSVVYYIVMHLWIVLSCVLRWWQLLIQCTDKISGQTKNWSFKHFKFTIIEYQHVDSRFATIVYPQLVMVLQHYYLLPGKWYKGR